MCWRLVKPIPVREFVELAFAETGRRIAWEGEGVEEIGRDAKTSEVLVKIDPRYFRPTEVDLLIGDPGKAKAKFGWETKVTFAELVKEMVQFDLVEVEREVWRKDRSAR